MMSERYSLIVFKTNFGKNEGITVNNGPGRKQVNANFRRP